MKPLIALDLDYTLIYPKDNRLWGTLMAEEVFSEFGVPNEAALFAYFEAHAKGVVTIRSVAAQLSNYGYSIDIDAAEALFYERVAEHIAAYEEVPEVLNQIEAAGLPRAIITAGDEYQQKRKAKMAGIGFEHFFAVDSPEAKVEVLKLLLEKHGQPIFFVDDLPHALDPVHEHGLHDRVTPVRIRRGPHIEIAARFPYREIPDLRPLLEMLKG